MYITVENFVGYFPQIELVDDLLRACNPKNTNKLMTRKTENLDQNNYWEANPESSKFFNTLSFDYRN